MIDLELTLPALALAGTHRMNYELPPGGITLTGYVVRRLHKTRLLEGIERLAQEQPALGLIQFGIYAASGATSWGPALYQPTFHRPGAVVSEADPDTGAAVTARYVTDQPHYTFHFDVRLPDGGAVQGEESITGTTVGWQGLGMPAPSHFTYRNIDESYQAAADGIITSELAPRLLQSWLVRGYGELQLSDNIGNRGRLRLNRKGIIGVEVQGPTGKSYRAEYQIR